MVITARLKLSPGIAVMCWRGPGRSARRWGASGVVVCAATIAISACAGAGTPAPARSTVTTHGSPMPAATSPTAPAGTVAGVPFARVTSLVTHECQSTADAVGYAVPCPTVLPLGMAATPPEEGCRFAIVAPAYSSSCRGARGWIFGTSQVSGPGAYGADFQHLVIWAAPRAVHNTARAIDGPTVYPERVTPRGSIEVHGVTMRWYFVPLSNPSAFRGHLVLLWAASGHTYVYGFHVTRTTATTRTLDLELVRHLRMVAPAADALAHS